MYVNLIAFCVFRMVTFLQALGCKTKIKKISEPDGYNLQVITATLPVPLKFPERTVKTKKERR